MLSRIVSEVQRAQGFVDCMGQASRWWPLGRAVLAAAAVAAVFGAGCRRGPVRIYPPVINASVAAAKAIEQYDTNGDGKLDRAELDACPALKSAFRRIGAAGDEAITAARIAARIRQWQDSRAGRLSLNGIVLRNGRPLADAQVRFVPEKFLGDKMKIASGTTDSSGVAVLSIPTSGPDDPPGIPPGFYRVEITAPGDGVPAKYNTESVLGLEVAVDATVMLKGIAEFDLRY